MSRRSAESGRTTSARRRVSRRISQRAPFAMSGRVAGRSPVACSSSGTGSAPGFRGPRRPNLAIRAATVFRGYTEDARRAGDVPLSLRQRPIELLSQQISGRLVGGRRHRRANRILGRWRLGQTKAGGSEQRAAGEERRALDAVAELADVARPRVGGDRRAGVVGQPRRGQPIFPHRTWRGSARRAGSRPRPLAQRGHRTSLITASR